MAADGGAVQQKWQGAKAVEKRRRWGAGKVRNLRLQKAQVQREIVTKSGHEANMSSLSYKLTFQGTRKGIKGRKLPRKVGEKTCPRTVSMGDSGGGRMQIAIKITNRNDNVRVLEKWGVKKERSQSNESTLRRLARRW